MVSKVQLDSFFTHKGSSDRLRRRYCHHFLALAHAAPGSDLFHSSLHPPPSTLSPSLPPNPLQPMPPIHPQNYSPEVSAACCLTAALSRLKALSAGPSRPFAPTPEVQRRAAALRKAGSADEARVAVRRPSIVWYVLRVVVGVEMWCARSAGSSLRVSCTFARLLAAGLRNRPGLCA